MLILSMQNQFSEGKHVFSCIKGMSKRKNKPCTQARPLDIRTLIQNPRVPNKYELTIEKIKRLKVGDTTKFKEPIFWYNNVINAWCISGGTRYDSFWIGFYDNGSFKFTISCYEDMCWYNFKEFYKIEEIEIIDDFLVQEKFLETINHLIDEGILVF